jgi:hypothetical protein
MEDYLLGLVLFDNPIRHSAKNNCPVSSDQGTECTVSVYLPDISGGFISYRVPNASATAFPVPCRYSFPYRKPAHLL